MNTPRSQRSLNHWIALFILLILLVSASGALGIVWMRQQIAGVAYRVKSLEHSLTEVDRKNRYLDAEIAATHHPQYLKRRVAATLRPPVDRQIVWISAQELRPFKGYLSEKPFNVSLDLALIDSPASEQ